MFNSIILVFILASVVNSQDDYNYDYGDPRLRIVHGELIDDPTMYPFMATVHIHRPGYITLCGGSILRPNAILTAAHCIKKDMLSVEVIAGVTNRGKNQQLESRQVRYGDRFIVNPNRWVDAAILLLKENLLFNNFVKPVVLAKWSDYWTDKQMVAIGYGSDENGKTSAQLKRANLQMVDANRCAYNLVCAKTTKPELSNTCYGDSGGPLVSGNTLLGVIVMGHKYCDPTDPSKHEKVVLIKNWILSTLDKYVPQI